MANHVDGQSRVMIAFPKSETELRVVFSEPVDRVSAGTAASYKLESGLPILGATVDDSDPRRVKLLTEPMNGEAMRQDVLVASGVKASSGELLVQPESPRFIQGIASIPELQKPVEDRFPFTSRFQGLVASASCTKDGGADSNVLIQSFGFAFIHMETGGPFNSLKIVTNSHIPGIAEFTRKLLPGQSVHVLWAGGEVRTVDGETRLVDTGFMEGSIFPPNPLRSPPPFPVTAAELTGETSRSLRAKSFQGVVALFEGVTIDSVSEPDKMGLRRMRFHDESGGHLPAVLLANVKAALWAGQKLQRLRGLVHQPKAGVYEIIIELDQHLTRASTEAFGHVSRVEAYSDGCRAIITLRDAPGVMVALVTSEHRLQTLLETALKTGFLIAFWGTPMMSPPTPRPDAWAVDAYEIDRVIVYDGP